MCAIQVRMIKDIITQPICCDRIVHIVIFVSIPVVGQFFWTQNEYGFVPVFIIFDYCQGSKGFTKTNAVCQNAAIVFFQLANDCKHGIFLKIIKH